MAWDAIATGVRLAGAIHAVLLGAYAVLALRPRARAVVPAVYAACLLGALLVPVLGSGPAGALAAALWLALPAATYLLVLQVVTQAPPQRRHLAVLVVPVVALPGVVLRGNGVTAFAFANLAVPVQPALHLYAVITGAGVLALVLITARRQLRALAARRAERPRYALAVAILGVQAVALGVGLLALSELVPQGRANLAAALVQVTMLYLVGSALFRLPVSTVEEAPEADEPAGNGAGATPEPQAEPLSSCEEELLREARTRMAEEALYRAPGLSRRDLAENLGVPEHQVTRILNVGLGQSFTQFVNGYRIAEAQTLLTGSDLQITEIAFRVGFNSLATFNRAFKEGTGMTPRAYRQTAAQAASVTV
ncbi:AraC-type DNA-binding protein [Limimonas halophila]|uniref:AraC-type DNA-binding protein n=1 Tax=Limimonas halophila TaxID=1082479 RepID=A0A1G7NNH9_9PROT|nr:AraC family transcriptional regulator [Limimonas halophila]SDF75501.1 AraC-type DNA-binding protein [Limimonas halophila]